MPKAAKQLFNKRKIDTQLYAYVPPEMLENL